MNKINVTGEEYFSLEDTVNDSLLFSTSVNEIDIAIITGSLSDCNPNGFVLPYEPDLNLTINNYTAKELDLFGQNFKEKLVDVCKEFEYQNNDAVYSMPCTPVYYFGQDKHVHIIHCHIPDFEYINDIYEKIYKNTLKSIIDKANEKSIKSLVIPVIGYGRKGYPARLLARMLYEFINSLSSYIHEINTLKTIKILIDPKQKSLIDEFCWYFKSDRTILSTDCISFEWGSLIQLKQTSEEYRTLNNYFRRKFPDANISKVT